MKLVIIFGPPAVGKMTVGYALETRTGLRLLHNHMALDLMLPFFECGHPTFRQLVSEFRTRICEEVAASDLPGRIFTSAWALDKPSDKAFVDHVVAIFRAWCQHLLRRTHGHARRAAPAQCDGISPRAQGPAAGSHALTASTPGV